MTVDLPERKTLDDTEMFDEIVEAILSVMGDEAVRIILYGSVARGDNTWESDVDIAVLTTRKYDDNDRRRVRDVISPLNWKHETLISVTTIDEKRFYDWVDDLPFYHNIDIEGVVLWTRENGRICLDTALEEQRKKLIFRDTYPL
ncbi:MAG: nucleotidyltransferase domain-containing protein [Synergistaceae bacterium]|nr:nucleotidyltransferase domain-containing protein [Synergistaceae bacterium]